ncbi:MAG: hypothetical protein EPN25_09185 [Nitrospirae bacterium]|nr:MAG: hypothetical protein EPN25_09185 [Nitrospirota bacterium]
MNRIAHTIKLMGIWALLAAVAACGGSGAPSSGSGATTVTIALKMAQTPSAAGRLFLLDSLPVPADVTQIRIIISGEHMDTMQRVIDVAGRSEVIEDFKVRSGINRHFLAQALAADGTVLYQGHRFEDLVGKPKLVEILMGVDISGEWTAFHRPQGGTLQPPDRISFSQTGNLLVVGGDLKGSGSIIGDLVRLEFISNLCGENVTVTGVIASDGKSASGTYEASGGCLTAPEAGIWKVVRGSQSVPAPPPGAFSNANLSGPWMWLSPAGNIILVFDGTGGILDVGVFNQLLPNAGYQVLQDGSFSVSLDLLNSPGAVLTGILTTAGEGILAAPGEGTGSFIKVADLSSCQGNWTGTLSDSAGANTFTIAFTIDSGGMVASFSGFAQPVTGRLLCEAGNVAGYFRTGEPLTSPYHRIQVSGSLSGNAVAGIFFTDAATVSQNGTASLVRQ